VRNLADNEKFTFTAASGLEIEKVEVFRGKYVVGHTPESLIIGNMTDRSYSEVPWLGGGNEKFNFDNSKVCVVFNAGEISLIEYGTNRILGSCRTEYMSPNLVSLKLQERKGGHRRIAYLMDPMTIQVLNLDSNNVILTIHHDFKIDSLKVNM
jgi:intraflagellar transport protein 172